MVSYAKLKVWDASGTELDATMQTGAGCVILSVNEATARYPLTIDPTFTQQAYLKANNTEPNSALGFSVAVSGDPVVIGAPFEIINTAKIGAAYVFVRSGTTWSQQGRLEASNPGDGDRLGGFVALAGNTAVVGARGESSNATGIIRSRRVSRADSSPATLGM